MTYSAAVIGCGRIGSEFADDPRVAGVQTHAAAYATNAETELRAVCDIDAERLERCARRWSVPERYRDAAELLAGAGPEIVSVCTPNETHSQIADLALGTPSVRALLVEKPLATSSDDADRIVRAAEARGVVLVVNHSRRYAPGVEALRQEIRTGSLGEIQLVTGHYTKGLLHNGSHWLDLARYLVGEIKRVRARNVLNSGGQDPTLDVDLEFALGARGSLAGLDARNYAAFEIDVIGTKGRARLVGAPDEIELFEVGESPRFSGFRELLRSGGANTANSDPLARVVDDVVRALRDGSPSRSSGRDGLAVVRIVEAARRSADADSWVEV